MSNDIVRHVSFGVMQVHSCKCEAQDLIGVCKMLKVPQPWRGLKTGTEIPSLLVHRTHSGKRSFWKENKATSRHHFPPPPLRPSAGLTDKVFSFRPLKAVNIRPQLPVAYHMVCSWAQTHFFFWPQTLPCWFDPLLLPKLLLYGAQGGSSQKVLNLTQEQSFQKILSLCSSAPPHKKCHQTDIKSPQCLILYQPLRCGFAAVTQTRRTGPLLTTVTTEPRSQTCVNWARHSAWHQDTRAPDLFHHCHCWH